MALERRVLRGIVGNLPRAFLFFMHLILSWMIYSDIFNWVSMEVWNTRKFLSLFGFNTEGKKFIVGD